MHMCQPIFVPFVIQACIWPYMIMASNVFGLCAVAPPPRPTPIIRIDIPVYFVMGLEDNLIPPQNIITQYAALAKHSPQLAFLKGRLKVLLRLCYLSDILPDFIAFANAGHLEFTIGRHHAIIENVLSVIGPNELEAEKKEMAGEKGEADESSGTHTVVQDQEEEGGFNPEMSGITREISRTTWKEDMDSSAASGEARGTHSFDQDTCARKQYADESAFFDSHISVSHLDQD